MASSRRCSTCAIDWPDNYAEYKTCAKCDGKTDAVSNGSPLDADEAASLKKHLLFDAYCAKRDEERVAAEKAEEAQRSADLEAAVAAAASIPDPPGAAGLMPLPDARPESD